MLEEGIVGIAQLAFSGCTALESLNIPASIAAINDNSFDGCEKLTLHLLPDSLFTQFAEELGIDYVTD